MNGKLCTIIGPKMYRKCSHFKMDQKNSKKKTKNCKKFMEQKNRCVRLWVCVKS